MNAYRLLSKAMSQIGKPISRVEDLAYYLTGQTGRVGNAPAGHVPASQSAPDRPQPVYTGQPVAIEDDEIIFDPTPKLTTQMDFEPNRFGYLVNGEGLVLMGQSEDAMDGFRGLRLKPIRLAESLTMPARATTEIRYKANLPRQTEACCMSGEEIEPIFADRSGNHVAAWARIALPGGEMQIFDERGRAGRLRFRWLKTGKQSWRLMLRASAHGYGMRPVSHGWQVVDHEFVFDDDGRLAETQTVTFELGRGLNPMTLDLGRGGLSHFTDSTGLVKVLACSQNGWPQAALCEVAVRNDGRVLSRYDNGRVELVGVAAFAGLEWTQDMRAAA